MFSNSYDLSRRISLFMCGVYAWMSGALAITAGTAYYVAATPAIFRYLYTHPGVMLGLVFAQLALVFTITFFINRISFATALVLFLIYSGTLGMSLASIFFMYTQVSIMITFFTTAGMFGAMSLYGYITKTDLTTLGNKLSMIVIGLIIGLCINMFLKSERFDYIISAIGVIVFVLLTAYDTQKIKQMGRAMLVNEESINKITLLGALTLYLDFINLFLFLLRLMGNRRE